MWIDDIQDFEDAIELNSKVVVDFTAPAWCNPCKQFAPHFEKAAEQSDTTFIAVDIDNAPWAMELYGVQSVPTVVLFENGEPVRGLKERTVIKLLAEINS